MITPVLAACLANAVVPVGQAPAAPLIQTQPPSGTQATGQQHALPLASLDDTLDVNGEPVAAQERRTRLTVPVQVNGAGPFQFVVDSGADRSVVGRRLAASLALPLSGCLRVHGMADVAPVASVRVESLRVGGSTLRDLSTAVFSEADLGAEGLLGIDALVDQRLKLDFEARSITVEDARRRDPAPTGDIVVTARRRRGQLILAQASAGSTALLAVIDTGSEVTIGNGALRARVFGRSGGPRAARPVELISVTGRRVTADLVVLPEVTIGGLRLTGVPIAFADVPPFAMFGLADAPALMLGTDVLQAFRRVTLDFRRRKVRFSLR